MIAQNQDTASSKCFRCKNVIAGYEDSYFCVYCNETYCPECLGYCKFYDLEEMEQLLLGRDWNLYALCEKTGEKNQTK